LDYGVEPSTCFKGKVHQVKVKYGSNQLVKVGTKDGLSLHNFFGYCQHMIELNNLQKLRNVDIHVLFLVCDEQCCFNENLN